MTTEERFWSHVDKHGPMPKSYTKLKTRCWVWTGSFKTGAYGQFGNEHFKNVSAHRFAFELYYGKGSLSNKLCCHKCDNPKCVRWSHLFKGTQQDNIQDKVAKGRASHACGEINGESKLTTTKVLLIRKLYATNAYSHRDLGVHFGVSKSNIQYIVTRKSWAHI